MSKSNKYCQCKMKRNSEGRVGWIPLEFAKVGRVLKLKINNKWQNGWTVKSVGSMEDAKYIEEHERDYKEQRKASDI